MASGSRLRGAIKAGIGDGIVTFGWVFCSAAIGIVTSLVATNLGLVGTHWSLMIFTCLLMILMLVFDWITALLGGASYCPTANATFYAVGVPIPRDSLISMAFRFPAQAAGAVAGAIAISKVMPSQYKHMLGVPSIKVDLHTAAIAEGVLTFLINLVVLIIVLRISGSTLIKTWLLAMASVTLVVNGSGYTGPSMNPANAFGWAYVNNWHNTWDHFYVYWICPFIGAIMAAWVFRLIFPKPKSQKKAPKSRKAD